MKTFSFADQRPHVNMQLNKTAGGKGGDPL